MPLREYTQTDPALNADSSWFGAPTATVAPAPSIATEAPNASPPMRSAGVSLSSSVHVVPDRVKT